MKARTLIVSSALSLATLTTPSFAQRRAALDPGTAEADARELRDARGYSFCTKPDDPLPPSARDLCPLARRAPGCAALVEACGEKPPEPAPRLGAFWERVLEALAKGAPYAAWAFIALLMGAVAYLVVRALRASREDAGPESLLPKSEVSIVPDAARPGPGAGALELLRRAVEARERGDAKTALVTYLAAALRALDERGAVRLSKDQTNGEYVRTCKELPARPALRQLVREVDAVHFGGEVATLAAASAAETLATRIVTGGLARTAAAVTLVTLGALLGACGGALGSHGDPAGQELLVDLLEKQGAEIERLPASLANLPMQGTSGPAIIIDLERVPLEEGTRDHLVAWVKQGGTLVIAGDPTRWPKELWAKPLAAKEPAKDAGEEDGHAPVDDPVTVRVETRDATTPEAAPGSRRQKRPPVHVYQATVARRTAMTWPSEDHAPRAIAKFDDGELYGALRTFGEGKVLGLASADLLTNLGLTVPENAAALVALFATLDRREFAVARSEQGITPPANPFAGLIHVGLGPALVHVAFFLPILFLAYGARQAAPSAEPPPNRRAFAEHIKAVGGLYAQRRAAKHALAVYARHVDERVRAAMGRGADPVQFLATRGRVDATFTAELYARALAAHGSDPPRGDELVDLRRLSAVYRKAMSPE